MSSAIQWNAGSDARRVEGMERLNTFFRHTRRALDEIVSGGSVVNNRRVHVVIGNEAADADSIVSSLVYAHHLHIQQKTSATLHIPVLSILREELALRCEVSALFQSMDVDLSALVFVNEFPWRHPSIQSILQLTLVDHNALNTKRIAPDRSEDDVGEIVEIIDHHMDLGKHSSTVTSREVAFANGQALVASCCTLIAERLLTQQHVDSVHATLLLSVMALDSINFEPSAKKVTPRDQSVAQRLQPYAFAPASALFEWLQAEKYNVTHWKAFTLENCLQCDYKEFEIPGKKAKYGVSSILIPLNQLMEKAAHTTALLTAFRSYCRENECLFLVIMTVYRTVDGTRQREILFYEEGQAAITRECLAHLEKYNTLQLVSIHEETKQIHMYQQRNTAASRKQVVPLLQEALAAQLLLTSDL